MNINGDELIARARAGDDEAFCQLVERYKNRIYSLAFFYCRDPHDAEDLSQEAWLKAYRALASFRGESDFYTWLRRITINTFLNDRRGKRTTNAEGQVIMLDEPLDAASHLDCAPFDGPMNIEDQMINRIMLRDAMEALSQLTSHQRMIFLLKHQEGMTYPEIASAVGCSVGTVKKALFRAITRLREHLCVSAQSEDCASLATSESLS